MNKTNKKEVVWYNNANTIINCIIAVIAGIVVCSQSFTYGTNLSLTLFGSVINHNSIYLLILIYFIMLKFSVGKKYFNYLNVFLMFLYFISSITSLLTMVQSFSLNTVLSFILDFIFLVYLFHTFFRDTRVWKELRLYHSPFNEFSNDVSFYSVIVISAFLLAVNLISTVVISGVILSTLDTVFAVLFGRYIFLYRDYLDAKKIDAMNDGNFDDIKEELKQTVDETTDKIKTTIEKVDLDDTVQNIKDKVSEVSQDVSSYFTDDKDSIKKDESVDKKSIKKKSTSSKKSIKKKDEGDE